MGTAGRLTCLVAGVWKSMCTGGADFFTGSDTGCDDCRGSSRGVFSPLIKRQFLLNSRESWICASSRVERAASVSADRSFCSSSQPASPVLPWNLARIHLPPLRTSVPDRFPDEMLQIPENFDRSRSWVRLPMVSPFLISRNVPLGSCITVTLTTFWYIVSF